MGPAPRCSHKLLFVTENDEGLPVNTTSKRAARAVVFVTIFAGSMRYRDGLSVAMERALGALAPGDVLRMRGWDC